MEAAIVIITYNAPELILHQIKCIRKFCKDQHSIIVVDNSTIPEAIEAIKFYCNSNEVERIKTNASSKNGSDSHSFAANLSFVMLKDRFDLFFYLDHDCFPVRDFSISELLSDNPFAGLGQAKSKTYIWPGCLLFDSTKIDTSLIDFSPSHSLGLDTGGGMHKAISIYGATYFNESYEQNPGFPNPPYNFYSMINDSMFMHFVNASGWNPTEGNSERINSLINILREKADI